MAKTGTQLANQMQNTVDFSNKDEFLRKHGLDKFYEFDGGDLWNINYDDNDKEIADYPMTGIRVGYGEPGWDEEKLLDEIEKLGRWKRPVVNKPVKLMSEKEALTPTPEEKAQFKNGQYNLKDEWNKQLDEWAKTKPDKKAAIDKMRDYDDEKIELTRAFMKLMGIGEN